MKQRGRKSKESADLVVIEGDFGKRRPDPPSDLTPRQAEIWIAIARDEPLEHFSTSALQEMLKDYCFHREQIEKSVRIMNEFPEAGRKSVKGMQFYRQQQKALDMAMRAATTLATKLRLTNQSRYTPQAAATASHNTMRGLKPWDFET